MAVGVKAVGRSVFRRLRSTPKLERYAARIGASELRSPECVSLRLRPLCRRIAEGVGGVVP